MSPSASCGIVAFIFTFLGVPSYVCTSVSTTAKSSSVSTPFMMFSFTSTAFSL